MEASGEIKRSVFAQGHFNVSQKTGNISHDGDKAWQSYWNTCVICWKLMFHIYPALCTRKTLLYLSWTCCMVHSRESAGCRTRRAGLALSTCHTHTPQTEIRAAERNLVCCCVYHCALRLLHVAALMCTHVRGGLGEPQLKPAYTKSEGRSRWWKGQRRKKSTNKTTEDFLCGEEHRLCDRKDSNSLHILSLRAASYSHK